MALWLKSSLDRRTVGFDIRLKSLPLRLIMKTRIAILLSLNMLGIRLDLDEVESLQALLRMGARCDTINK
jgi:hypothetical protein